VNPFVRQSSEPLAFDRVDPENIREAAQSIRDRVSSLRDDVAARGAGDKQVGIWLRDKMFDDLDRVLAPIYLLKETHPDPDTRTAAREAVEMLFELYNGLSLDEGLYTAMKGLADSARDFDATEQRYVDKVMESYHRNGFQLDAEKREQLRELDNRLSQKELAFQRHIGESDVTLTLTEPELEGLPDDFKDARRQDDGTFAVSTRYPDYFPMLKSCKVESVRKRLYYAYLNRAREENLPLLDEILGLRIERAAMLGFPTYAALGLDAVMAGEPATVWRFIDELTDKVADKARDDMAQLREVAAGNELHQWDRLYYTNKIKEERYQLEEEAIRVFFPLNRVLDGIFEIVNSLYGVRIEPRDLPVWSEDVEAYEILDDNGLVGRFYLDIFPRPNKYGHAACFGFQSGRRLEDGYQPPHAALVCNFTPPTKEKPSLLNHDEVETFFHEFGHLMHHLLTSSPLSAFAGTSVERDFVEMPSQIMEHWAWDKASLSRFAAHYQTGETIPEALVDKMLAVKKLGSGLDIQQQLFYASLDMTLHDGFIPEGPDATTRAVIERRRKHTLFPVEPDTAMQASFGHLVGYAAAYYGYLWSRVYADDMFEVFREQGLYDKDVGTRFREAVLGPGNTEEPMALMQRFLGRKPRMDAFLEGLGV